jgi:hypothetical protein
MERAWSEELKLNLALTFMADAEEPARAALVDGQRPVRRWRPGIIVKGSAVLRQAAGQSRNLGPLDPPSIVLLQRDAGGSEDGSSPP